MISDNIPIFDEYQAPDELEEPYNQLYRVYKAITEFNAVISLNQALLLQEYKQGLIIGLSQVMEEIYDESVPYYKTIEFYTGWVISESDIKKYDIDESQLKYFNRYQKELQLIEKIMKVTGGCNCEKLWKLGLTTAKGKVRANGGKAWLNGGKLRTHRG